jgi:hypothetical protein
MKRPALSLVATIAALAMSASAASAATYINYGPVGADGGFTITFGDTGITAANFSDTFDFKMPTGRADFVVTTTMSGGSQNITWSNLTFNGEDFDAGASGWNEFRFLNDFGVTGDGEQHLVLTGAGGGNAAYSGVITFMPVAVPEPGTWALMILGFGGLGALLRRNRASALPVFA